MRSPATPPAARPASPTHLAPDAAHHALLPVPAGELVSQLRAARVPHQHLDHAGAIIVTGQQDLWGQGWSRGAMSRRRVGQNDLVSYRYQYMADRQLQADVLTGIQLMDSAHALSQCLPINPLRGLTLSTTHFSPPL